MTNWFRWAAVLAALLVAVSAGVGLGQEELADDPPAEAAPGDVAPDAETKTVSGNFFVYFWTASPFFFVMMLLASLFLGYLVIHNIQQLQVERLFPAALIAELDELVGEKKFRDAYELLRGDESAFAKTLRTGVERLGQGYDRALDSLYGAADDTRLRLEHSVSLINSIGAIAPMVGLLGTVLGMILAFQKIGFGTQIQPALLGKDIGLALVTTLEGIVVAIPAIAFYSFFRNRIARLVYELETRAESYLARFQTGVKK